MTGLSAAILVGGQGRRMGGAIKPLLKVDGRAILDRQLDALRPHCAQIAVVGNSLEPFDGYQLAGVHDVEGVEGPLAGLLAALSWSPTADLLVVAGDMPNLHASAVEMFIFAARENPDADVIAARHDDRIEPLHAIYRKRVADRLGQLVSTDGYRSPTRILERELVEVHWIDLDVRQNDALGDLFRNVNELTDLP